MIRFNALSGRRWERILSRSFECGLGILFLLNSMAHIRLPYKFLGHVYECQFAGPKLGLAIAMLGPWLQFVVGICLVINVFTLGALLLSAVVLAVYAGALVCWMRDGLTACRAVCPVGGDFISGEYLFIVGQAIMLALILADLAYAVFARRVGSSSAQLA